MTIKQTLYTTIVFAIISLATPFVWLKMGANCYEYYGPNLPDVYILGAWISGKDTSFWAIGFAYIFQLTIILYFILSSFRAVKKLEKKETPLPILIINMLLLLLFPFWLSIYIQGIRDNSGCTDMTTYPHVGSFVYFLLLILNIMTIIKVKRIANKKAQQ